MTDKNPHMKLLIKQNVICKMFYILFTIGTFFITFYVESIVSLKISLSSWIKINLKNSSIVHIMIVIILDVKYRFLSRHGSSWLVEVAFENLPYFPATMYLQHSHSVRKAFE